MAIKGRLRLPALRLRGTIVLAAAVVFTLGIAASIYYTLTIMMQSAVVQGNALVNEMADSEAGRINQVLGGYANAARSMAQTGTVLLADPAQGPKLYGDLVIPQLASLDKALGAYMLFTPAAGLGARAGFENAPGQLNGGYFASFASRGADGKIALTPEQINSKTGDYPWTAEPLTHSGPTVSIIASEGMVYTSFHDMIRDPSGKVVGISGVAFDAASLNALIGGKPPMGSGFMGVMAQDGTWIVNVDPKAIGTVAKEPWAVNVLAQLKNGDRYQYEDQVEGAKWEVTAARFNIVGADQPWTIVVAVPQATLLADAFNEMRNMLIGGGIVLGLGLVAFWFLGGYIARPVNRMTAVMRRIAGNEYDLEVPYADRRDDIGEMAQAVEVFRENGLKVAQMTEADAARIIADQKARTRMMSELQTAFGNVVDAAVKGDFSRRVEVEFPDAELNTLAGSVNNLVETVDGGLAETSRVLSSLAQADLTERVTGTYSGAFDRLKGDTNAVADKLTEIVGQLRQTSQSLKQATGEILSGTNDLSERTTKQAATIEETSAAMDQLASTVVQNAERANEASKVAGTVTRTAEEGGAVMSQANGAMAAIEASSGKISNIIGMIDDIAFQTNLLALNASVEAARAGDAGKGFAVVAVEVRRLAQSAASASSEVKALIEQSEVEVKGGSRLVAEAAGKLEAMLSAARTSSGLMDGIAKESREQASAIDQVNVAVRQLDEMTQHNAALVEETNAAIEQTEAQAVELDQIVSVFTIDEGTHRVAAPKAAPRAAVRPAAPAGKPNGVKSLQQRVSTAARTYLTRGNAAVAADKDWSEF